MALLLHNTANRFPVIKYRFLVQLQTFSLCIFRPSKRRTRRRRKPGRNPVPPRQSTGKGLNMSGAYMPQASREVSAIIRRLAWKQSKPMTKTIETLVMALPAIIDPSKVCLACKDNSNCKACIFGRHFSDEEKAALLAVL